MPHELYAVSAQLKLWITPAATFAVETSEGRQALELSRDEAEILLRFSKPSTVETAFDELAGEWEIDRSEFEELIGSWIQMGVLARTDGPKEASRLQLYRQAMSEYLTRGRRGLFPLRSPFALQRPGYYYPGLNTLETHAPERFPWTAPLEAAAPAILAELESLLARRESFTEVYKNHTSTGSWAAAYFWVFGKRMDEICDSCPETTRLLESIPGVTTFSTALFSALAPGTDVQPHCGISNAKLRCQLPLRVPERCGLRIADSELQLEFGKCVVFDDSFLHSAWNMSDRPRFVLLFDFFHPDLTPPEIEYLLESSTATKTQGGYLEKAQFGRSPDWVYE